MDNNIKILIFSVNGEAFGVDIGQAERIIGYEKPTEIPESPSFIDGVIKHEDKILPIVNMSKRFSMKYKCDENRKIIVIKREEKKFGILVDNVYEVKDISKSLLENPPDITKTIKREYIKSLVKLEDKIVILLDLEKILSKEDEQNIF